MTNVILWASNKRVYLSFVTEVTYVKRKGKKLVTLIIKTKKKGGKTICKYINSFFDTYFLSRYHNCFNAKESIGNKNYVEKF